MHWTADADEAIAPQHKKWFNNTDEVKPVNGTSQLLVTASLGGVAIIDIAKNKASFYAHDSGNLHSAALLPDGNIVAAASNGKHICLFDKKISTHSTLYFYTKQFLFSLNRLYLQ